MRCPVCAYEESKVVDSRPSEDNLSIRRRRECLSCNSRFTTYERIESTPLLVVKTDGSTEEYDRDKLLRGLLIACAKRPVSPPELESLIDEIEAELRNQFKNCIRSKELGDIALSRLKDLDPVAYIRFASVYKDFKNLQEFAEALDSLG